MRHIPMKKMAVILVSAYIGVISAMLAASLCYGTFHQLFVDPVSWGIHRAVSFVLVVIGAMTVVCLLRRPSIVPMLQVLWWLPQLVKVEMWHFWPDKSCAVFHSLYHWPMGVTVAVQAGSSGDYLFVKLNLIALAGAILAAWLWTRQRPRPSAGIQGQSRAADEGHQYLPSEGYQGMPGRSPIMDGYWGQSPIIGGEDLQLGGRFAHLGFGSSLMTPGWGIFR